MAGFVSLCSSVSEKLNLDGCESGWGDEEDGC